MENTVLELVQCQECYSWHPIQRGEFIPFNSYGEPTGDIQPVYFAECRNCKTVLIDTARSIRNHLRGQSW
jgi:hypothetical protein